MPKKQVCYAKYCWKVENTILGEAERREEYHFDENLIERTIPHTHIEDEVADEEAEISKAVEESKKIERNLS